MAGMKADLLVDEKVVQLADLLAASWDAELEFLLVGSMVDMKAERTVGQTALWWAVSLDDPMVVQWGVLSVASMVVNLADKLVEQSAGSLADKKAERSVQQWVERMVIYSDESSVDQTAVASVGNSVAVSAASSAAWTADYLVDAWETMSVEMLAEKLERLKVD